MIFIVFNAFCSPSAARIAIERFFDNTDLSGLDYKFIQVDSMYPLPDFDANRYELELLANEKDLDDWFPLSMNYGSSGNMRMITKYLRDIYQPEARDVVAFWDPDSNPRDPHWLKAAACVLQDQTKQCTGLVSPYRMPAASFAWQGAEQIVGGYPVRRIIYPPISMRILSWAFLSDMMEIESRTGYRANLGVDVVTALDRCMKVGYMLTGIEDLGTTEGLDPEYVAWKSDQWQKKPDEQEDFEPWIKAREIK